MSIIKTIADKKDEAVAKAKKFYKENKYEIEDTITAISLAGAIVGIIWGSYAAGEHRGEINMYKRTLEKVSEIPQVTKCILVTETANGTTIHDIGSLCSF